MAHWKVLLINLDHSTQRLQNCKRQLEKHKIVFERLPAVWGSDIDEETLSQVYPDKTQHYYKNLNLGEIGCYLSHVKAWQKIHEQRLDFALILEDDFLIENNLDFEQLIHTVNNLQKGWHYIKLGGYHNADDIIFNKDLGCYELVTFNKVPNRTCSQFVSALGAQRLLKHCLPVKRPLDVDLRYWWEKEIYVQALLPYTFMPNKNAESEILKFSLRKNAEKRRLQGIKDKAAYHYRCRKEGRALKIFLSSLQKYNADYPQESSLIFSEIPQQNSTNES